MSWSVDVMIPNKNGKDIIADFYDFELSSNNIYQHLLNNYKDLIEIEEEAVYDTTDIQKDIESKYTINMSDYYVSDGWRVWVDGLDEPLVIPLSDIPFEIENRYTLKGDTCFGIDTLTTYYKQYVRDNNLYFIQLQEDTEVIKLLPEKLHTKLKENPDYIIVNSY